MPDFCASSRARFPAGNESKIGDEPKSKSLPGAVGQFPFPGSPQDMLKVSPFVNCLDQDLARLDVECEEGIAGLSGRVGIVIAGREIQPAVGFVDCGK
jgi:hypothetical protein